MKRKKDLRVIVYPSNEGEYPAVLVKNIRSILNGEESHYNSEFSISFNSMSTKKPDISVITESLKNGTHVDIFFWNRIPEKEIKKLLKYDLEKLNGVCLSSINHNFLHDGKDETKKTSDGSEKTVFETKWQKMLKN